MATVEPVSDAIEDDRDLEELWREMERPLTGGSESRLAKSPEASNTYAF